VFLGFNPSQLVAGTDAVTMISDTLTWLGVGPALYVPPTQAVIRHTSVRAALANTAVVINAFVVGTASAPTLSYRAHDGSAYLDVTMTQIRPGVWQATIPADVVTTNDVDYIISVDEAVDPFSKSLPHVIAVPLHF